MKHLKYILFVAVLGALTTMSRSAYAYLELNAFYASDNFVNSSTTNNTKLLYDVSLGFAVDKKEHYLIGWNYTGHSTTNATTTTESYSSTQMGPRFIVSFDKAKMFSLGFTYNLQTQASFNNGSQTYTWKGSAMKADFGVNFPMGDNSFIGFRLNYSAASYKEQLIGTTNYTVVAYTRTFMYPSIYMFFGF